ncbi:hypothetical protein PIB30_033554 [Stylosanthes scabra]|uniref:Uncharacterized protein n=1 Tax=Stylosanthes scabra TaxID=79078 RepID=A0ABU6VBE3_9FABA|nr:hypothetical protein [Stylosanthes scabra]
MFESWVEVRVKKEAKATRIIIFFTVAWCIWGQRNRIIFNNKNLDLEKVKHDIIVLVSTWLKEREMRKNENQRSGFNRKSSERKWPERAKGRNGSQQNLEGHCWTRCVRNSEAMRTHLDVGGTTKR